MFAYVGSRTTRERNARGDGISVFECNAETGALVLVQVLGDLVNPSFLAMNTAGDRLYAVHGDCEEITSFKVEKPTGRISVLNRQSTKGKNPVHLALDPTERFVVVSNHITSSLAVLPIESDGALSEVTQLVTLQGRPGRTGKSSHLQNRISTHLIQAANLLLCLTKGLIEFLVSNLLMENCIRQRFQRWLLGSPPAHATLRFTRQGFGRM